MFDDFVVDKMNTSGEASFKVGFEAHTFDFLSIGVASPEQILNWSFGEVKSPDTMNYRTFKPEKDGLFCAKIFGPVKKYQCICGKYNRIKYKGIICEKCGTEITDSVVRRERMGHITLNTPVVNVLYLRSAPSVISTLLDNTLKELEKVISFDKRIVYDTGNSTLSNFQLLSDVEYEVAVKEFGLSGFRSETGSLGIKLALESLDVESKIKSIENELLKDVKSVNKRKLLNKKFVLLKNLLSSNVNLSNLVFTILPVLPAGLRPIVTLDGGKTAMSDLNSHYKKVITRNARIKRLEEVYAPDIITRNEKRMLQDAVDNLINSSLSLRPAKNLLGRPLKSIADFLKGKQGRFRQNLLGKRVDYSGRSVIIVGPNLKLHQCGIPKEMVLELFKFHVSHRLCLDGIAPSTKIASIMIDQKHPYVWNVLEDVIAENLILLNRAPTLHRLSIQAFEIKLIDGKSIQLHPLVCKAFNADFDGDQMAVHLPLSIHAQLEARILMLSSNNIISPADGQVVILPRKDIVAGLYYQTSLFEDAPGKDKVFSSYDEVLNALDHGIIKEQSKVNYRFCYQNDPKVHSIETTPGRIILFELLPKDGKIKFEDVNFAWDVDRISKIVEMIKTEYGKKETVIFCDKIMNIGFHYNTLSGLSLGKDDIIIPDTKTKYISDTVKRIAVFEEEYKSGLITEKEKVNKTTDEWFRCTDLISSDMMKKINENSDNSKRSCILDIMNSGSRASAAQLKQLGGMRGLISKPSGQIIETPVISNFKEGLTVLEYFNSANGARKGNVDTALKTAEAGYLTRRLVDVSQDCIVLEHDCKTKEGCTYDLLSGEGKQNIEKIVVGRVAFENITSNGKVLFNKNHLFTRKCVSVLKNNNITSIKLRSPVLCNSSFGICSLCYGYDMLTERMIEVGEPVGIIAAQSIGEPGTQLTLRTFYIGGAASKDHINPSVVTKERCILSLDKDSSYFAKKNDHFVFFGNSLEILLKREDGSILEKHKIPSGAKLFFKDGDLISQDVEIANWDSYNSYIIAEKDSYLKFIDLFNGLSYKETYDELSGNTTKIIINWINDNSKSILPSVSLVDKNGGLILDENGNHITYKLSPGAILMKQDGDLIKAGDFIARIPNEGIGIKKDITGGLPRIEEIFEASNPKSPALIAPFDGHLFFSDTNSAKLKIILKGLDGNEKSYNILKDKFFSFRNGTFVKRGDIILDGNVDLQSLIDFEGTSALIFYFTSEIKKVYALQGVNIDAKHIEVIMRYMLNKVEVLNSGDSILLVGQKYNIEEVKDINRELESKNLTSITFKRIISGVTNSSLTTSSFLSAASFQETIKVLIDAALRGAKDPLRGMKENIIIGRLLPAGTGYVSSSIRKAHLEKIEKTSEQSNIL